MHWLKIPLSEQEIAIGVFHLPSALKGIPGITFNSTSAWKSEDTAHTEHSSHTKNEYDMNN